MAKVLSIEVGDTLTRLVELDYRDKTPRIYHCLTITTPSGTYEDGYLSNIDLLAAEIKKAVSGAGIKAKQAVCTVSSSKIANREIMLPAVKMSQIPALINANAMDYFPIDLSQYELGHIYLETVKGDDGTPKHRALVMACENKLLDGYRELCTKVGLKLMSVDYSGNSIFQVMKQEVKADETEMVIRIEEHNTIATIIKGNTIKLQRNITYGIDGCIESMIANGAFPEKTYAECIATLSGERRINLAISDTTELIEKDEELKLSAREKIAVKEMTEALSPLVTNVERLIDLYNSRNLDTPIKKVAIIGLGADVSGLSKLFTNELGIKTVIVENIKGVNWTQAVSAGSSGEFATAIGAAYDPVGFISEESAKKELANVNYRNLSILLGLFIVVLIGVMCALSIIPYREAVKENEALKTKEALYLPAEKIYNDFNSKLALYEEIKKAYSLTESNNDGLLLFLAELENKLPSEAVVTSFDSDNTSCKMSLRVRDMEQAAKVIQTVRDFESVEDISIGAVREEEKEKIEEQNEKVKKAIKEGDIETLEELDSYFVFELICNYYSNGASQAK